MKSSGISTAARLEIADKTTPEPKSPLRACAAWRVRNSHWSVSFRSASRGCKCFRAMSIQVGVGMVCPSTQCPMLPSGRRWIRLRKALRTRSETVPAESSSRRLVQCRERQFQRIRCTPKCGLAAGGRTPRGPLPPIHALAPIHPMALRQRRKTLMDHKRHRPTSAHGPHLFRDQQPLETGQSTAGVAAGEELFGHSSSCVHCRRGGSWYAGPSLDHPPDALRKTPLSANAEPTALTRGRCPRAPLRRIDAHPRPAEASSIRPWDSLRCAASFPRR